MSPFLFCSLARLVLLDVGLEKFVTHLTVVVVQIVAVLTGSTLLAKVTLLFLGFLIHFVGPCTNLLICLVNLSMLGINVLYECSFFFLLRNRIVHT